MLPNNTGTILTALGYEPLTDFECAKVGGEVVINTWSHVDTQPTEQQLTDWSTDAAALPSGQLFRKAFRCCDRITAMVGVPCRK